MSENAENKTINGLFNKQLVSARLSTETIELIDENFVELTGGSSPVTDRKLIECILDLALSKGKPNSDLQKKVDQLSTEIAKLQEELKKAKEANLELNGEVSGSEEKFGNLQTEKNKLEEEVMELQNQISEYQGKLEQSTRDLQTARENKLPDNAILIQLSDKEKRVLDTIGEEESKRTGKTVTNEILLKNVFFFILVNGPHDVFSAPVHIKKLREMLVIHDSKT